MRVVVRAALLTACIFAVFAALPAFVAKLAAGAVVFLVCLLIVAITSEM